MRQERVLILMDYYLPGERAGGPVWTVSSLIERLGDHVEFAVATRDHDLGSSERYREVPSGHWVAAGKARCRYLTARERRPRALVRFLRGTSHDVLYINTLWSVPFVVVPLLARRLHLLRSRIVLAPRGQLDPGALAIRKRRKCIFLGLARVTGIMRGVTWQASSPAEATHIRLHAGRGAEILVATNLRPEPRRMAQLPREARAPGPLRVVFLSRISEKKNLHGALEALARVREPVEFHIYGPREDPRYWNRCEKLMHKLPDNVRAHYLGVVAHDAVETLLSSYDLLLLPTFGENFGHVIREALTAGCPVLISDRTPWRGLEAENAGWDVSPDDLARYAALIEGCARESDGERARRSAAAAALGSRLDSAGDALNENAALFAVGDLLSRPRFAPR